MWPGSGPHCPAEMTEPFAQRVAAAGGKHAWVDGQDDDEVATSSGALAFVSKPGFTGSSGGLCFANAQHTWSSRQSASFSKVAGLHEPSSLIGMQVDLQVLAELRSTGDVMISFAAAAAGVLSTFRGREGFSGSNPDGGGPYVHSLSGEQV